MGRRVRILCIISGLLFAAGLVLCISGCTDLDLLQVIRDRVEGVDVAPTFTVTYDKNSTAEGSLPEDTTTYEEGQTVTVLANSGSLEKTDYLFSVWNTSADGSGTTYVPGETFIMGAADVIMFAKWITQAQWARTVSAGSENSIFCSIAIDDSGNIYAAGYQHDTGTYTYGSGVSAAGTCSGDNPILVKYDSAGTALWARTISAGSSNSRFLSVAVDGSGNNIYAAGYQSSGLYTYGSENVTGTGSSNVILVKYDTAGTAQWARTVSAGTETSKFYSIAIDVAGNVYAAGYQSNNGIYTYGSHDVTGTSTLYNVLLVKYNASGTAQWARTVSSGSSYSHFESVAVDNSGNVYAAGYQYDTGTYTYGSGVSAAAVYSGHNVLLVKYNNSGTAQWVQTVSTGLYKSHFLSVVVDSSGNVYTAGYQSGISTYTYGNGVNVSGAAEGSNVLLVKYNTSGAAQWAHTLSAGSDSATFTSLKMDSQGNLYAAGQQSNNGTFSYGNGVSATASSSLANSVLVKYDTTGSAQWARTVSAGSNNSYFNSIVVDASGYVYTAGRQKDSGTYTYGGQSITGTFLGENAVLVKWEP